MGISHFFLTSQANGDYSIPDSSGLNCSSELSQHCIWFAILANL
jgi:hypothetical protein